MPLLTPAEMLMLTAELKHPRTLPRADKRQLVDTLVARRADGGAVVGYPAAAPAAAPSRRSLAALAPCTPHALAPLSPPTHTGWA